MKGRTPTADEKRWMASIASMGCCVCRIFLHVETPAEVHHIDGKTKQGAHHKTIPLCARHHRQPDTMQSPRWISLHGNGRKAFAAEYLSELELLEWCRDAVAVMQGALNSIEENY